MNNRDQFGLPQLTLLIIVAFALGGCGFLFGSDDAGATPEANARVLVPTFTPTPMGDVVESQAPAADTAAPLDEQPQEAPPTATPIPPEEPTSEPPTPEPPTATPVAKLMVNIDAANVRNGPGTNYGVAGSVTRDQTFDIKGRSADGTWWQFCCVNGQEGWIFADLVRTENADNVAVAESIPDPPPVAVAPPAPAPVEQPQEEPPPPSADPCPNLDGCTFRLTGGPTASENGGMELKLQLAFIHGGRGDEAQGSYFVGMNKDGVKLPIPDSVRSWTGEKRQGIGGLYNYEYKLGLDDLPGRSVAGNYEIWAIDGNGNQASPSFPFSVGGSQGEIWIEFNQG